MISIIESLNKKKLDYIFLFSMILLFFSHWINIKIIFLILSFYFIASVLTAKSICRKEEYNLFKLSILFSIFVIFIARFIVFLDIATLPQFSKNVEEYIRLDKNNLRLILIYLNPFIIFVCFISFKKQFLKNIKNIALAFFWISVLTVIFEFILINFLNFPQDYIPTYRDSIPYYSKYIYFYRPFGLTGNPAINGGLILGSLILLNELKLVNLRIIFFYLLSTVINLSGQAFIVNILYLFYLFIKNKRIKINFLKKILLVFALLIACYLLFYPIYQQKLNFNYISSILFQNMNITDITLLRPNNLFFGTWGLNPNQISNGSEIFYIYQIREFGIIFSLVYYLLLIHCLRKTKDKYFNYFIFFLTNIHYPILLSFECWLIIYFIYLITEKRYFLTGKNTI